MLWFINNPIELTLLNKNLMVWMWDPNASCDIIFVSYTMYIMRIDQFERI